MKGSFVTVLGWCLVGLMAVETLYWVLRVDPARTFLSLTACYLAYLAVSLNRFRLGDS